MDRIFNINYNVRVRLTGAGVDIYRRHSLAIRNSLPPTARPNFPIEPSLQIDGTYRDQMWRLMAIFGHHMAAGAEPPFNTEIILEFPDKEPST